VNLRLACAWPFGNRNGNCNDNDNCKKQRQEQLQKLQGWVMAYIPPIVKCAMDGAPGRLQKAMTKQLQMLLGWVMVYIPPIAKVRDGWGTLAWMTGWAGQATANARRCLGWG
jgi:energy-converting hydrogenase Eha subunit F